MRQQREIATVLQSLQRRSGTPEEVALAKQSYTGQYLGKVLSRARVAG